MSTEALTPAGAVGPLPDALLREIDEAVAEPWLALMVYGSQARGSADQGSDVDVLTVVSEGAGLHTRGRVTVTAYTAAHLHAMAQSSSLFVLHLRAEGIILSDPRGVLERALAAYVPMKDFEGHRQELREAASALFANDYLFASHGQSLTRMGIYLLRTALYLNAAEAGRVHFDIAAAAETSGYQDVVSACALRRAKSFSAADLQLVTRAVELVLRMPNSRRPLSARELQSRAIELSSSHPHAAALVTNALFGAAEIDYVGIALAPW